MKKILILSALTGYLLLTDTPEAGGATPGKIKKNPIEAVRQEIIGNLPCPEFITENSEINQVKAIVKVDERGFVTIEEINTANPQLKSYVEDQLLGMRAKNTEAPQRFVLVVSFQVD